jgi:hypothetical protein
MQQDIEKTIATFKSSLAFNDPDLLAKVQIEVQIEMMRRVVSAIEELGSKLDRIEERVLAIDWKLWEITKATIPELAETPTGDKAADE